MTFPTEYDHRTATNQVPLTTQQECNRRIAECALRSKHYNSEICVKLPYPSLTTPDTSKDASFCRSHKSAVFSDMSDAELWEFFIAQGLQHKL